MIRGAPRSGLSMLISWISCVCPGYSGRPPRRPDFPAPIRLKPARCQRMIYRALRSPTLASLGKQSIEQQISTDQKYKDCLPERRAANVALLPKHPDLCLQCCSRSHQVDSVQKISLQRSVIIGSISRFASARNWIRFTIGTLPNPHPPAGFFVRI